MRHLCGLLRSYVGFLMGAPVSPVDLNKSQYYMFLLHILLMSHIEFMKSQYPMLLSIIYPKPHIQKPDIAC